MWVETDTGAVNLDHIVNIFVSEDDGWRLIFVGLDRGWAKSEVRYDSSEEAQQALLELIEKQNHPLRVVNKENPNEQEDTQGEGPRRTD